MKIKCIGGLSDGKVQDIDNHYREGDQVRVHLKMEFDLVSTSFEEDLKAFRDKVSPKYLTMPYEHYKVKVFYFQDGQKIKFLIPVNWTIKDAMVHLLGC